MYVVQSFGGSNFYTDSLKEAEDAYFEACQSGDFVQLLEGMPGNFTTVRQNW